MNIAGQDKRWKRKMYVKYDMKSKKMPWRDKFVD
jgi:hypothetical protein